MNKATAILMGVLCFVCGFIVAYTVLPSKKSIAIGSNNILNPSAKGIIIGSNNKHNAD